MLLPVLAGAVGIGTVGHLENALTFSPVQLVIDNELAKYVRRALRETIVVNEETLATEAIDAVGPGGNFLADPHTAAHFREEHFFSPMFRVVPWETSHRTPEQFEMATQAKAIAAQHWHPPEEPVLDEDQIRAIDAVVARSIG